MEGHTDRLGFHRDVLCRCCATGAPCVTNWMGASGVEPKKKAAGLVRPGLVHSQMACTKPPTSEQTGKPWSRVICHTPQSFRNRRLATRPTLRMGHDAVRPTSPFSQVPAALMMPGLHSGQMYP